MTKRVELEDFSNELEEFKGRTLADQKKAVVRGIQRSIPDLVRMSPVDTGFYAESWDFRIDELKAVIGNYAPYAGVIEHGARPHRMPIKPLLEWAKRVLKSSAQPPDYDKHVWALARGVQNKIAREGQQPKHILQNAIPKIIQNIREELKHV